MRHVAFSLLSFLSLLLSSALLASSMSEDSENSGDAPTRPPITGSKSARKKEHKRRAVEAYLAIDGDAQPSLREWWSKHCVKPRSAGNHQQLNEDVSNRHRVCFATFCAGVKTKLQEERPAGRPRTFTDEEEQMIVKAVREAEACMTFLTPSIIQQEVWHVAILPREDEKNDIAAWQAGIKQRISRCSSERFIRSFCARHRITGKKGRPMETYRAAKMQPEIIVQHFRLIFHTWALCQIQRAIVRDDRIVPGWHVPPAGLVTRDDGSGHDPGPDMLEMRDGTMFVIPLDEPLEALPNDCRMAADEKPLCPDSPVKKQLSAYGTRIVYMSRSKWWTVMPWFAGDRVKLFTESIVSYFIQRNGRSEATVNQALYGAFLGTEEDFSNRMDTTDDLGIIRGTSCRIATPQGRLLTGASATRELDESAAAAEDRRRAARESAERAAIKTAADMPVKSLLEQLGYLPEGSRMIKNHLQHFIVAHRARWRPKEAVPAITAARESLRDAIAAFIQTVNDRGLISKRVFRRAGRDTTMELRSAIAPKASRKRTVSQMQVTDVTSNDTCEPPAKR